MDDNSFNPDIYLADKTASDPSGGFNPDQYLAEKSPPYKPMDPNEPGLQDVSIPDAMMVQGVGGLAKAGAGLAAKGVGAGLEAISPNLVPSIGDISDDMLLKGMGTRAGQIKQLGGLEAARDAADVGRQAGAADVFSTERGRMQNLQGLIKNQGQKIGQLRQEAGNAPTDVYDKVKQSLMAKYNPTNPDVYSSQLPKIDESLNTVKNVANEAQPTHAGISKGITELNDYATGEKLRQPVNAFTDVANNLSAENNSGIAQSLGADKAKEYLDALHNESGAFHLQPVLEKGMAREAVARGGGKGILQSLIQKGADAGGYRAASKGFNALHGALTETPDLSGVPQNALRAYLAQKADEDNQ